MKRTTSSGDIIVGVLIALKVAELTDIGWATIIILGVLLAILEAVLDLIEEALTSWRANRARRNGGFR